MAASYYRCGTSSPPAAQSSIAPTDQTGPQTKEVELSDIFISYASADRERARLLADVLAEQGWSVWWDRIIPPGKQFDEVIEEALDAAKCVVVLWSQASAASTWVKTEAAEAMRRKVLIPAVIEDVKIPLEFRRLQAADLSRWTGDRADPQLAQFFQSIEAEVTRSGATAHTPESAPAVEQPRRIDPPPAPVPPPHVAQPAQPQQVRKGKLSPALIGGIVAATVALVGAGIYFAGPKSAAPVEQAVRMKPAQEQAQVEPEPKTPTREDAPQASKPDDDRKARRPAPVAAERPTAAARRETQPVAASGVLSLQWRDHALGYSGNLSWNPSSALLQVNVVDLRTGTHIGNYAVPASVFQQAPMEYLVSAQFAVPGDSTTPGPHAHTSRLLLRAQQDGSLRFLRNCPQPGECY